jgi:hypothetical protein
MVPGMVLAWFIVSLSAPHVCFADRVLVDRMELLVMNVHFPLIPFAFPEFSLG